MTVSATPSGYIMRTLTQSTCAHNLVDIFSWYWGVEKDDEKEKMGWRKKRLGFWWCTCSWSCACSSTSASVGFFRSLWLLFSFIKRLPSRSSSGGMLSLWKSKSEISIYSSNAYLKSKCMKWKLVWYPNKLLLCLVLRHLSIRTKSLDFMQNWISKTQTKRVSEKVAFSKWFFFNWALIECLKSIQVEISDTYCISILQYKGALLLVMHIH